MGVSRNTSDALRYLLQLAFYSLMGVSRRQFASKRTLLSGALSTPFWEFPAKNSNVAVPDVATLGFLLPFGSF